VTLGRPREKGKVSDELGEFWTVLLHDIITSQNVTFLLSYASGSTKTWYCYHSIKINMQKGLVIKNIKSMEQVGIISTKHLRKTCHTK